MSEDRAAAPTSVADDEEPAERDPRAESVAARRKLTAKQRKLLDALADHHYQPWRAGAALGYSKRTIGRFLRDPHFKSALVLKDEVAMLDVCIKDHLILQRLNRIALATVAALHNEHGDLKLPHEWDPDNGAAVIERSFNENGLPKIRIADPLRALDLLTKYTRLIVDRHEVTGKNGVPLQPSVLVVPGMVSESDWTAAAADQQHSLSERETALAINASVGK